MFKIFPKIYLNLFKLNDTPQKIALGLGLGVLSGVMPGSGPIAALFLAWIFRANRAAALLATLLTNTWLSLAIFLLSIKAGSAIMGISWQEVQQNWTLFLKGFHWLNLFKLSVLKIILPVIVGYFILAFGLGLLSYGVALLVLVKNKNADKSRVNLSR